MTSTQLALLLTPLWMIVGHLAAMRGLDAIEVLGPFAIAVVFPTYVTLTWVRPWAVRWVAHRTQLALADLDAKEQS